MSPSAYTPERWRQSTYGLDDAAYRALVDQQGGCCAVCETSSDALVVDHDHATGRVRALLCSSCNRAIGHLRDDPALCRAAAAYLLDPPGVPVGGER